MPTEKSPSSFRLPDNLPGIDLRTALLRLAGDAAMWSCLMRQFETSQGMAVAEVRQLLAAGMKAEAAGVMHRLRGVAANLGATMVAGLAVEAEAAIKDGQDPLVPDLLERLQAAMAAIFALARQLPDAPRKVSTVAMPEGLPEGLAKLRQSLGDANLKAMAEFEALQASLEAAMTKELVRPLAAAIEVLDFATAEGLVLNMMKMIAHGAVHEPE